MHEHHERLDLTGVQIDNYEFLTRLKDGVYGSVWLADEYSSEPREPSTPGETSTSKRALLGSVAIKVFVADSADRDEFAKTFTSLRDELKSLVALRSNKLIVEYHYHTIIDNLVVDRVNVGHQPTYVPRPVGQQRGEDKSGGIILTMGLMVMDYADGGHLGHDYRQTVVLQHKRQYLDHFIDVCTALRDAHSMEIKHRDIKPSNLLWFRKRHLVRIADFGIAEVMNKAGRAAGSLRYLAPESFPRDAPATFERDIYALGCTFYELLTGSPPFKLDATNMPAYPGAQCDGYRDLHQNSDPPDAALRENCDHVSPHLSNFLKKMMAKNAAERPSLKETIEVLRAEAFPRSNNEHAVDLSHMIDTPGHPTHLGPRWDVHPRFLRKWLGQSLFFIFLRIPVQTPRKYKKLFESLRNYFGDTHSVCETYGQIDFIVRVWAPADGRRIRQFCEEVIEDILQDYPPFVRVMCCCDHDDENKKSKDLDLDDVTYLGAPRDQPPARLLKNEILIRLDEAQTEETRDAIDWLRDNRIYLRERKAPEPPERVGVTCFCLLEHLSKEDRPRDTEYKELVQVLESSCADASKWMLSVHRRGLNRPQASNDLKCDDHLVYVVSYVAPTFEAAKKIPHIILGERLSWLRLKVATYLATGDYFVQSDRVDTYCEEA